MTQEEKKLLYKDLSARQPYRPFICFAGKITVPFLDIIASTYGNELMSINGLNPKDIKPYLRPMSSMTKEEWITYQNMCDSFRGGQFYELIDYLNAHHFDYRGLIEKGLAVEAPDGMYA